MLESYVRNAPRKHELNIRNIEAKRYACKEYGERCGEWLIREALVPNGHSKLPDAGSAKPVEDGDINAVRWQNAAPSGKTI